MPVFSEKSKSIIHTCDRRWDLILNDVIQIYDLTVIEGWRSDESQDELFRQGKSKLQAGESKHNQDPSLAVDVCPYPIDWDDRRRFFLLAGMIFMAAKARNIEVRWGGDWDGDWIHTDQSFHDLPHFEILE